MNFFRNLWKKNPKLIMYIGGMFILIGFIKTLTYEVPTTPNSSTTKTNEAKEKLEAKNKSQE